MNDKLSSVLKWCCVVLGLILAALIIYISARMISARNADSDETPEPSAQTTGDPAQTDPPTDRVTRISFSEAEDPTAILTMEPGERKVLEPILEPEGASAQIAWSTSDEQVVTVDSSGTISCLSPGLAVITASADDVTAQVMVEVSKKSQGTVKKAGTQVDTILGAHFIVPDGFRQMPVSPTAGYIYRYYNDALDMEIVVFEIGVDSRPDVDSARECAESDYRMCHEGIMDLGGEITFQNQTENKWVLSGYLDDGATIFYRCEIASDDDFATYAIDFEYPAFNAEVCNPIVGAFMRDFTYDR